MPDIRLQPIPALTYLRRFSCVAGGVHIRVVRLHSADVLLCPCAGVSNYLSPAAEVGFDEGCEFPRRSGRRFDTLRGKLFLHIRLRKNLSHFTVQLIDDLLRCAHGRYEAKPDIAVVTWHTRFGDCRKIRKVREALACSHSERTQLSALDMGEDGVHRCKQYLHLTSE